MFAVQQESGATGRFIRRNKKDQNLQHYIPGKYANGSNLRRDLLERRLILEAFLFKIMADKIVNLKEFTAVLESYRETLEEMKRLTESEIKRISSLKINISDKDAVETPTDNQAAIFINNQINSFLEKLTALVSAIPEYNTHSCLSQDEIRLFQERALAKLRELRDAEPDVII